MKTIEKLLNSITMYRLVVYVLFGYIGLAIFFSFIGKLSFSPTALIISLTLITIPAFVIDKAFGLLFKIPTNSESWLISSLILLLILQPVSSKSSALALILAGAVSSASKFILTWNNKHIFNPAALAAGLLSLTAIQTTSWWIGSSIFWPFTLILGIVIVYKIRRFTLLTSFISLSVILQFGLIIMHHQHVLLVMKSAMFSSPIIFLSTIMLTEPATMPPRKKQQIIFGFIISILYINAWTIGRISIYPEIALLIGNIYAFIVSPKLRLTLKLKEVQKVSDRVYNYVFQPNKKFNFLPGQYMEWTVPNVPFDSRGNRRTFTIASSPTETDVQIGLKYYEPSSAYKNTIANMKIGDLIFASQLAGNFTINPLDNKKLVFIAGGIGITPFRSMIKYLFDMNIKKDITLLYVVSDPAEIAYTKLFFDSKMMGVKFIPIVTKLNSKASRVINAKLSQSLIESLVPDFSTRTFYLSGPDSMVRSSKEILRTMAIANNRIKTDYFSGY